MNVIDLEMLWRRLRMKMQQPVAPPNNATFLFFQPSFFAALLLTHILPMTETFIIIGEESGLFWIESSDLTVLGHPGEEESWNKSYANPARCNVSPG